MTQEQTKCLEIICEAQQDAYGFSTKEDLFAIYSKIAAIGERHAFCFVDEQYDAAGAPIFTMKHADGRTIGHDGETWVVVGRDKTQLWGEGETELDELLSKEGEHK